MSLPPAARRAYDAVAIFALLNLIALGGAGAYLSASGVVDGEKLRRIGAVLRGETPEQEPATEPESPEREAAKTGSEPAEDALAESQMSLEIMRREADRIKEELRQQLALANSIMIRVTAKRESYQRQRERDAEADQAVDEQRNAEGFKKEIDILKGLKGKKALAYLLGMDDPEEAARILLAMDTRSAKRILEATKTAGQVAQMRGILRRMRQAAPERSSALNVNKE